jgi:hypothetical protein
MYAQSVFYQDSTCQATGEQIYEWVRIEIITYYANIIAVIIYLFLY